MRLTVKENMANQVNRTYFFLFLRVITVISFVIFSNSFGEEEDAPVQGPLPYEPDDAPWKKASESGIRKL